MHESLDSGVVRLAGKRSQEIIDAKYQARQVKRALVGASSNGNFRAYMFRHELCRFHQDREPAIARGIGHLQAIDFIEALNRRSNNPRRFAGGADIALYVCAIEPNGVNCPHAMSEAFLRSKPPALPERQHLPESPHF
jgi:hypothetical protein